MPPVHSSQAFTEAQLRNLTYIAWGLSSACSDSPQEYPQAFSLSPAYLAQWPSSLWAVYSSFVRSLCMYWRLAWVCHCSFGGSWFPLPWRTPPSLTRLSLSVRWYCCYCICCSVLAALYWSHCCYEKGISQIAFRGPWPSCSGRSLRTAQS